MTEALGCVDRMEDFMWASIVLGWHLARMGDDLQAHALSTSKYPIAARPPLNHQFILWK